MSRNWVFIFILLALSLLFLYVAETAHIEFFLHLAAIPLEVLMAVFIVEKILEKREIRRRKKELMYLKSYMFRSGMRRLFVANFNALQSPPLTIKNIGSGSLEELTAMRKQAESVEYKNMELMESVVLEYVKAEPVWINFMDRAIHFGFDAIFHDMIEILHFVYDVKTFKEYNNGQLFVETARGDAALWEKTYKIIGDGIRKFLDYAIELKRDEPEIFTEVMTVFEQSPAGMSAKTSEDVLC